MKLVVGLGNPGSRYANTRHNLGFLTVERLAADLALSDWQEKRSDPPYRMALLGTGADGDTWVAMQPQTFMNESGTAVGAYARMAKIDPSDLWVVHDDVDLPAGELREAFDSGSAGHRGVQSIIDALGTKAFHRIRIGVGRSDNPNIPTDDFVLETVDPKELVPLVDAAATLLRVKLDSARG